MAPRCGVDALGVFVRQPAEDFNLAPGQTVTRGMRVAHHKPDPLGFERAAHVLLHVIEDLLQGPIEIGLLLFNVRTVTHKFLSHCCHSFQAYDDFPCVLADYTPSKPIRLLDEGIDRYFGRIGD